MTEKEDEICKIVCCIQKAGSNCEIIQLHLDEMKRLNQESSDDALNLCTLPYKKLIKQIKRMLLSFIESEVVSSTSWNDPQYWVGYHSCNGIAVIEKLTEFIFE